MSDGQKTVRMVSFDASLHKEMDKSRKSCSAVKVTNCQVKKSSDTDMEIVVTNRSKVFMSPKKMKLADSDKMVLLVKNVSMKEVHDVSVNQSVSICVKVLRVSEPIIVLDRK